MQNKVRLKRISDATLFNFMLNFRIDCRVIDYDRAIFEATNGSDLVRGSSPRDALSGLYILLNGRPS